MYNEAIQGINQLANKDVRDKSTNSKSLRAKDIHLFDPSMRLRYQNSLSCNVDSFTDGITGSIEHDPDKYETVPELIPRCLRGSRFTQWYSLSL